MSEITKSDRKAQEWIDDNVPDLTGKVAIVTGANKGIGFETAKILAEKGAEVIIGCRNLEKGEAAIESIKESSTKLNLKLSKLDLASLESVRSFAIDFEKHYQQLNILVNNGGISMVPYMLTEDGFESQIGTNFLGHFALTGLLIDLIKDTPESRVVALSSNLHASANIKLDGSLSKDEFLFDGGEGYSPQQAYARSKLAQLLFIKELQERHFVGQHADKKAIGAHPGGAKSGIFEGNDVTYGWWLLGKLTMGLAQSTKMGALPSVSAATNPDLKGGTYIGPQNFNFSGFPKEVLPHPKALDKILSSEVWRISKELTKVNFGES
jgi:NAD(P)-dependent dehydrogenase (short-subunit alcohol dehydrogenase family)